jgi:tetratricopeptide (TPR) repeat protein
MEPTLTDCETEYRQALKLEEEGNFSEAAPRLAALVAATTDARVLAAYGFCLQKLGRWAESIPQFESALALKPAYCESDWRNMLAQSYLHVGQKRWAIEQWRIVADTKPTYPSHGEPIDEARQMLKKYAS